MVIPSDSFLPELPPPGLEDDPDVLTVPLDPADELSDEPPPLVYNEDDVNLVFAFQNHEDGKKALRKIGGDVVKFRDDGLSSTEKYRQDNADTWKLFGGWTPPKPPPFDFGNQPYVPIILENSTRQMLRAYQEMFGQWNDLVSVDPMGADDVERAKVMSYHDNFQLRYEIPDFRIQQQRGLLMFFVTGDVISHSFWDDFRCENRHEMLISAEDIIIPYVHTTTRPDLSDVPWRIEVLYKYRHELKQMDGRWAGVQEVLKGESPIWQDENRAKVLKASNELFKIERPTDNKDAPYEILWFEGWLELPGQSRDRFCQAVVDAQSETVFSLRIWEQNDWKDEARFNAQQSEKQIYEKTVEMWQQHAFQQAMMPPQADPMTGMVMPPQEIPPPPRPSWAGQGEPGTPLEEPEPIRKVPISLYSHVRCIQSIKGSLGIGMGAILKPPHKIASASLSAFLDAAMLGNGSAFLAPDFCDVNGGAGLKIGPGAWNVVGNMSPDMIDKAIKEIRLSPANSQLLDMATLMKDQAENALHSNPVLSGAEGKSGETYRGLATRVEQAGKPLSAMAGIYWDFVVEQLRNNAFLNSIYLPEEVIKSMVDSLGVRVNAPVRREWWKRDYRVTPPRNGLRFVSDAEKIAEADEERQIVEQTPELRQNPYIMSYVLKKQFTDRGCFELAKLVDPAMQQSMQMQQAMAAAGVQPGQEQGSAGGGGQARPPSPPNGGIPGREPAAEAGAPAV